MKTKAVILILILSGLVGCFRKDHNDTLIQVGSFVLTAADFEHLRNQVAYKDLTFGQLEDRLLNEGRILAYALDHRYDTIELLEKRLEHMLRFYTSEVDGFLWNKRVKPRLSVTEEVVKQAYQKRANQLHLDVIHFPDEETLKTYCPDGLLQSEDDFYKLRKQTRTDPLIKSHSTSGLYPFYPFGPYTDLEQLDVGEVVGPFQTLHGFFVIHLTDRSVTQQPPYEHMSPILRQELLHGLKDKYIWESQQEIFQHTLPFFYINAIEQVAGSVHVDPRQKQVRWPGVEPNMVLMTYQFQGEKRKYTLADFDEFVHFQPVFLGDLSKPADVKKMIQTHLIGIYMVAEAQKMGAESDREYVLSERMYRRKIYINEFRQKLIDPHLGVSASDAANYFDRHKSDFTTFESASISVCAFKDLESAYTARRPLIDSSDSSPPGGYIPVAGSGSSPNPHIIKVQVGEQEYNKKVIETIGRLEPGEVSAPVEVDGEFWLIRLMDKAGTAVLPYQYVEDDIRRLLSAKKEQEIMDEIGEKYQVKINNLTTYLRELRRSS